MSELQVTSVTLLDFSASARHEADSVLVQLTGTADLDAKPAIDRLVVELHEEVQRLAVAHVVIDLKRLEFMNSSCFKSFVSWIQKIVRMAPDDRYQMRFLSDPAMAWQSRSLSALSNFAPALVTVDS